MVNLYSKLVSAACRAKAPDARRILTGEHVALLAAQQLHARGRLSASELQARASEARDTLELWQGR